MSTNSEPFNPGHPPSQLTSITYMSGSTIIGNLTYTYDLAGRRTGVGGTYARTNAPQAASTASYNLNNQLTQWKGASLTYDANGNLTGDGTNTYTWSARNQLVSISGVVSASFQYDPFGRRVSKTIGGTTQYLYDGVNPVQEISGATASANLLTGGVDEYFQRTDSAGARNFLTDALGSTLAVADSTGALQTQYTFEPFGNTSVTGASTTNSFAYTGRELDSTGLYYYRARYYSSSLSRFVSPDPSGFFGGVNLYTYVGDDPAEFSDAFGLDKHLSFHFSLNPGIRAPGQTFQQCMEQHAQDYSIGGAIDLASDVTTGSDLNLKGNPLLGNGITGVLYGSPEEAATDLALNVPDVAQRAIGSSLSYGRRTTDILALNLAGKGGVPQALSNGLAKVKSVFGDLADIVNLGLSQEARLGIDIGSALAEGLGCSLPQ